MRFGTFILKYVGKDNDNFINGEFYEATECIDKSKWSFKNGLIYGNKYDFDFIIDRYFEYTEYFGYLQLPIVINDSQKTVIKLSGMSIMDMWGNNKINKYPERQYINSDLNLFR